MHRMSTVGLLTLSLLASGCTSGPPAAEGGSSSVPSVQGLSSMTTLKASFNHDAGKVRLLLVLSPTCATCLAGASWVQKEILQTNPTPSLRVYAIWVPFHGAGQQAANLWERVLPDPRVLQYWDGTSLASGWFAKNVEHSSFPVLDAYFLYGSTARWTSTPGPLVSSGSTVIGRASALKAAIAPLLGGTPAS